MFLRLAPNISNDLRSVGLQYCWILSKLTCELGSSSFIWQSFAIPTVCFFRVSQSSRGLGMWRCSRYFSDGCKFSPKEWWTWRWGTLLGAWNPVKKRSMSWVMNISPILWSTLLFTMWFQVAKNPGDVSLSQLAGALGWGRWLGCTHRNLSKLGLDGTSSSHIGLNGLFRDHCGSCFAWWSPAWWNEHGTNLHVSTAMNKPLGGLIGGCVQAVA
jgi:hypothetical protein